ncbi:helix-turn-helix domain-containing protein [Geoalkalibacter halelectricus]|uniref:helix-turn-helix domain-containing protein n=1 Tax=Geoalkalibacter halelectricus TaxID=2847045 RepID=UPI003D1A8B99
MTEAEQKLRGMLKAADLPVRPSYRRGEVCEILGIDKRTFWRMVAHHEPTEDGQRRPGTLDSYMTRGHHRVRYDELVDYLARNRTWQRQNATDPRQMGLFREDD